MNIWAVIEEVSAGRTGRQIMERHEISRATLYRVVKDARHMGVLLERVRGQDRWTCGNWSQVADRVQTLKLVEQDRSLVLKHHARG